MFTDSRLTFPASPVYVLGMVGSRTVADAAVCVVCQTPCFGIDYPDALRTLVRHQRDEHGRRV